MSASASRRGFLRDLVSLPLIGGGLTLVGTPTAAAVPVTGEMVATYLAWLHFELRYVSWGAGQGNFVPMMNHGACFHSRSRDVHREARRALERAPLVLAAVGCPMTCEPGEEQGRFYGPDHWREGVR